MKGASRVARAGGETALTALAALGAVSVLLLVLAFAFEITLILFRTGSMEPTIPAGSVALVRRIPAAEVEIGDVVTVDRPGKPPVTHRVTGIAPGESPDQRLISLKGDANPTGDGAPYAVSSVRIVLGSVPGLAQVVVWFWNPLVLAGMTIAASALVGWALWPQVTGRRYVQEVEHSADTQRAGKATAAGGALLIAASMLVPAGVVPTDASWTQDEYVAGSFTAKTVPTPQLTVCDVSANLLTLTLSEVWVDFSVPAGYSPSNVVWRLGETSGSLSTVTPTVSARGNGYRATFKGGLIGQVLQILLGGDFYLEARTKDGSWFSTSQWARVHIGSLLPPSVSSCTVGSAPG